MFQYLWMKFIAVHLMIKLILAKTPINHQLQLCHSLQPNLYGFEIRITHTNQIVMNRVTNTNVIFSQVGPGFAIAAALYCRDHAPGKRVICVEGDSAFGFSGMELETMVRYNLPVVIVIVNNGGIYGGFDLETFDAMRSAGDVTQVTPPSALGVEVRYEQMMQMFGQKGHFVRSVPELKKAIAASLAQTAGPSVVNVVISPSSDRKPQTFAWLTESKL